MTIPVRYFALPGLALFAVSLVACTPPAAPPVAAAPAALEPVDVLLSQMAAGDGLSEEDAKKAAELVCERLWGTDAKLKVAEAQLNGDTWEVLQWSDEGVSGWGCRVFITQDGSLRKAEYVDSK